MAAETLVTVLDDATFTGAGPLILSPAERALLKRPGATWLLAPWLADVEAAGVVNARANGVAAQYAAPISASVFPTRIGQGGPDDQPYFLAGTADPVGSLRTPAGVVNIVGDFTIAFVGRASNNATGCIVGIEGAAGNAKGIALRSSDLVQLRTYTSSGGAGDLTSPNLSGAATSADWHLIVFTWDASATLAKLFVDGTEVDSETISLTFGASRLNLFAAYDPSASPAISADADTAALAWLMVLGEYVGAASDPTMALIEAACEARFPSILS